MSGRICARALAVLWSVLALTGVPEPGFVSLFDGKSLNGWQFAGREGDGYLVEKGVLVCPASGGGNLFTVKQYADFIFRFEFRLESNSNNGVGIRCPLAAKRTAYDGMEIQIIDNDGPEYKGKLQPWQHHGSLYGVAPAKPGHLKKTGEWNQEEIVCKGRRITVHLNGTTILDVDLDSVRDPEILKQHPGLQRQSGHLGFLGHGSRVEFRNLRIKEL